MRKCLWVSLLLSMVLLIMPSACKAPAAFEVVSLDITPAEVAAGDTAIIKAEVKNTGGSQGVYAATLIVDSARAETKDVTVAPGTTATVTFSLVKDKIGTYNVAVGEMNSSLTVKPKLVAKEIELKYDDGEARDCLSAYPPMDLGGYLVDFTPPSVPFTIKKVRIHGTIYGKASEEEFGVEIWDKDHKVLYKVIRPVTMFPTAVWKGTFYPEHAKWVEIEIPDVNVTDKFYVHVYTGTGPGQGIHIGADDSIINAHSESTGKLADGSIFVFAQWPYNPTYWYGNKNKVNWMIRVAGTVMVPEE